MVKLDDIEVGVTLAGRARELSLARILAFSGGPIDAPDWPERNLHTDLAKAREAGLEQIIASGTQSEGLLIGLLIEAFGTRWYDGGELEVRFVKPVRVNDTVTPVLRWTAKEREGDALRISVACWCELADGTHVLDGTASCVLPITPQAASPK